MKTLTLVTSWPRFGVTRHACWRRQRADSRAATTVPRLPPVTPARQA